VRMSSVRRNGLFRGVNVPGEKSTCEVHARLAAYTFFRRRGMGSA
jgi:hypothetical protein